MYEDYMYPDKHKRVCVFREIKSKTAVIKEYIHPENTELNAFVRHLSSTEQTTGDAVQNIVTLEFVLNFREIYITMFIEFDGKVYAIDSTDGLGLNKTEIKLRGYPVNAKKYSEIRWQS